MRGETQQRLIAKTVKRQFQSTPLMRGETFLSEQMPSQPIFQSTPLIRGETSHIVVVGRTVQHFTPLPSCEGRPVLLDHIVHQIVISIHSPHARGDCKRMLTRECIERISIHSPHARGDSISLQKSIRIYVSLHNKTMIHRFSGLYKPLFAAQSPIFGVRSPRKSHDSFTFARPSVGRGITP